jgi:membrane-bound inhibitor of C-type lysozyme
VNVRHLMHLVAGLCLCPAGAVHAETIDARFNCDGGKSIDAAFDNGPKPSVRLSLSDGRHLILPQARSGSGARYANGDESIVFWNKGDTAVIEESGRTTYRDCVARR